MPSTSSTASRIIHAELLTPTRFAPFGAVLEAGENEGRLVNQGRARRIDGSRDLSHEAGTRPVVDLYRIEQSKLPFTITCFERHPLSCQIFTPMSCARFLVVVAPAEECGGPDFSRAVAFLGQGDQAVCYGRGIWHAPMVALEGPALMAMSMWEAGDDRDCEEFSLGVQQSLIVDVE